jgi:hypothetical protein
LCQRLEVQSSGQVLAQQTVGVFVASALPGRLVVFLLIADRSVAGHR